MKRYISLLLTLLLLFALLPLSSAGAAGTMKASSKIMDYIKSKEGCKLTAYQLPGETYYTIGYGSRKQRLYRTQYGNGKGYGH